MRITLHTKTLLLAREYHDAGGKLQDLAPLAKVSYQRIWQWVHTPADAKPARLNADAVQHIYEHLTGKELDY